MYNRNREAKALLSGLKSVALMCEHYEKAKEKDDLKRKRTG
jgi:hypothetical protein